MTVSVEPGSPPRFGRPAPLLTLPPYTGYVAMAPDGDRFVAVCDDGQDRVARELHVVLNWSPD